MIYFDGKSWCHRVIARVWTAQCNIMYCNEVWLTLAPFDTNMYIHRLVACVQEVKRMQWLHDGMTPEEAHWQPKSQKESQFEPCFSQRFSMFQCVRSSLQYLIFKRFFQCRSVRHVFAGDLWRWLLFAWIRRKEFEDERNLAGGFLTDSSSDLNSNQYIYVV